MRPIRSGGLGLATLGLATLGLATLALIAVDFFVVVFNGSIEVSLSDFVPVQILGQVILDILRLGIKLLLSVSEELASHIEGLFDVERLLAIGLDHTLDHIDSLLRHACLTKGSRELCNVDLAALVSIGFLEFGFDERYPLGLFGLLTLGLLTLGLLTLGLLTLGLLTLGLLTLRLLTLGLLTLALLLGKLSLGLLTLRLLTLGLLTLALLLGKLSLGLLTLGCDLTSNEADNLLSCVFRDTVLAEDSHSGSLVLSLGLAFAELTSLLLEGLEDRHDILLGDTLVFGHAHDLILLGLLDADIGGERVDLLECGGIVRSEGDGAGEGTKSCDSEEFHFKVFVVGSYLDSGWRDRKI